MWTIYALGGGWGHLNRACALARVHPARILTNSPYAAGIHGDFNILHTPTREAALEAARNASVLIVDTFPRGLGGELAQELAGIQALKVLIHRDLNPDYVAWAAGLPAFVDEHYDLVLAPGEGEAFPQAHPTAPWLIRDARELPATLSPDHISLSISGKADEHPWYAEVADLLCRQGIPVRDDRIWPAMERFAHAAAVIGGGGYNTVYECQALGVPLIARAWPRKYDRQRLRLERTGAILVNTPAEAVAAAIEFWPPPPPRPRPDFENGVHTAADLIKTAETNRAGT